MVWIMIDVEADGPIPGEYSMVQLGAVLIDQQFKLDQTFYGKLRPISENYNKKNLNVFGVTREETLGYDDPKNVMKQFNNWIIDHSGKRRPFFISDNNGFDYMFVAWYFHKFLDKNPFGHSSTNLGSLYKGLVKNMFENFKHLRKTKHTHHPVEDAIGNAEALIHMKKEMGLNISFR